MIVYLPQVEHNSDQLQFLLLFVNIELEWHSPFLMFQKLYWKSRSATQND